MARLLRIALLSLLLVGLSFQSAWAGAYQCPEGQDMQQRALEDISSVVADTQHEPETGDMALIQDCGAAAAASCSAMASSCRLSPPCRSSLLPRVPSPRPQLQPYFFSPMARTGRPAYTTAEFTCRR